VVCDGSTDNTPSIARAFESPAIQVVELQSNQGKAVALNHAARLAKYEIMVLADARQTWNKDAIKYLLDCFQDERVGAVSGQLVLKTPDGKLAGVGMYWKYEKWLRGLEAQFHSQIGVTGAISAVRRKLFPQLPAGIILDDVYWPMQVVMQDQRVVYQPNAKAFDELPARSADELRRKVRTLVGNFQLMTVNPALLAPWKNPLFWQFVSHKVMRLIAPWALLIMLSSSAFIDSNIYRGIFLCLAGAIVVGFLGMLTPLGQKNRLFSTAGSFLLLQFAAWIAFWYWIFGRTGSIWTSLPSQPATADQV
jgi:cellulose synthase/poly-beta-1,6-N-acetylglucosamine synthase-like glycosyltransferase